MADCAALTTVGELFAWLADRYGCRLPRPGESYPAALEPLLALPLAPPDGQCDRFVVSRPGAWPLGPLTPEELEILVSAIAEQVSS
jgi:hypothetical protein